MANDIEELYLNGTRYGFNDERLANKANVDGAYEAMTVGNAEQLVSSVRVTDKTPYLFRTAGGNLDIGDRKYTTLVGADVAVNQLLEPYYDYTVTVNGITFTFDYDTGKVTVTGTATARASSNQNRVINVVAGHKYYLSGMEHVSFHDGTWVLTSGSTTGAIGTVTVTGQLGMTVEIVGDQHYGVAINGSFYPMVIDLTQILGTSIADTAYTKEQATAGSGIAWLKANGFDFSKYRAHNAGSLESVNPSAIVTRGFNQWDEEWESGAISASTGNPSTNADYSRSKNFCKCLPNTNYYRGSGTVTNFAIFFYDANKNYIGVNYFATPQAFTTPTNAYYFKVHWNATTYNNDICINLHWDGSRDGEYEPYSEHEYALGNVPLHGIFKLVDGNIQAVGDTRTSDGTVTRKYGTVDLGTLTWHAESGQPNVYYSEISDKKDGVSALGISSKYPLDAGNIVGFPADKTFTFLAYHTYKDIFIKDTAYATAAAFKTAMSGVYLVYELATPTTETTDSFTNPQVVDNWGTEEFTTENDVPVGNETEYPQNLRDKLESIPNPPNGDGDYIVRQTGGTGEYRAVSDNAIIQSILAKLPNAPSEDGAYKLTCTVTDGTAVYSWEAE